MPSTVTFSGLPSAAVFAGYGTHCRGPHPSSFFLVAQPGTNVVPVGGDLVFTDTDNSTSVTFKNCIVDKVWLREHYGKDPQMMWHLRIFDRRYLWAKQVCSYEANVRAPDCTVQPWSKKSARQVATELLNIMGESGYDVADVPDDVYPYVAFSGPPAFALSEMVRRLGGYLTLQTDDSVAILWPGTGGDISSSAGAFTTYHNIKLEKPSSVKVVCGDTWWESMFDMECVGLEWSGSSDAGEVKPVADLDYAPAAGWAGEWPQFFSGVEEGGKRSFAFRSVYRWYRISSLAEGGLTPTNGAETPSAISQLLPVRGIACRGFVNQADTLRSTDAEVYGVWWPQTDHPYNTSDCQLYPGGFDLDEEHGIVKFHETVFKLGESGGSGAGGWCPECADLKLWVAHRLRITGGGGSGSGSGTADDPGTYQHKEFDYPVTGGTGEPHVVYVPELFLVYKQTYPTCATPTTTDNETEITSEADAIGAKLVSVFEDRFDVKRIEYPGIYPVETDGDIAQVSYHCNQQKDGTFPTRTVVSVGDDGDWYEQESDAKEKAAQTAMAVMERMKGGPPSYSRLHIVR